MHPQTLTELRFSLGTVKNENVLYYFIYVLVLKDSNLLNLMSYYSIYTEALDISSSKF